MQQESERSSLGGFRNFVHTIENRKLDLLLVPRATRISAMVKIGIPPDLAGMFAACEDAYEQATREGYAENPAVTAAVSALKSAWKALHVANYNLMMARGFFPVEIASLRVDRARRATRKACINLNAAIVQAAAENRLYNRCLMLANADQDSGKRREGRAVA